MNLEKAKRVKGLLPKEEVLQSLMVALNLASEYSVWQEQLFNIDLDTLDYLNHNKIACVCDGDLNRIVYIWDI